MTTFYLDYEGGNDANDGTTFANLDCKLCAHCGQPFHRKRREGKQRFSTRKYCSQLCSKSVPVWNKGTVGLIKPNSGTFKPGQIPKNKGVPMSEEVRAKVSAALKGNGAGRVVSEETRRKISEAQKGEKSAAWRGGLTAANQLVRMSLEYRLWREEVFKRDNWTCCLCNVRGGTLHSHHIKSFAAYPEHRFDVSNGQTLCVECHKTTDSYGRALN